MWSSSISLVPPSVFLLVKGNVFPSYVGAVSSSFVKAEGECGKRKESRKGGEDVRQRPMTHGGFKKEKKNGGEALFGGEDSRASLTRVGATPGWDD
jgi:hypothetical protein